MRSKPIFILTLIAVTLFAFKQTSTNKLTVKVTNINNKLGKNITIGVFEISTFPKIGKAKYEKTIIAKSDNVTLTFEIPNGDYAVAVYHDLNSNKTLDTNFLGIPKEPYGFSKNFKPGLSAPDFKDCSFTLNEKEEVISISLIH